MKANSPSWYIPGQDGQPAGPFTGEQILQSWRAGRLNANTLCWREGMPQWLALAQVEPFATAMRSASSRGEAAAQPAPPPGARQSNSPAPPPRAPVDMPASHAAPSAWPHWFTRRTGLIVGGVGVASLLVVVVITSAQKRDAHHDRHSLSSAPGASSALSARDEPAHSKQSSEQLGRLPEQDAANADAGPERATRYFPDYSDLIVSINVSQLVKSDIFGSIARRCGEELSQKIVESVRMETGIIPGDISRVTFAMRVSDVTPGFIGVIELRDTVDQTAVLERPQGFFRVAFSLWSIDVPTTVHRTWTEEPLRNGTLYVSSLAEDPAMHFPDDRTVVLGPPLSMRKVLERRTEPMSADAMSAAVSKLDLSQTAAIAVGTHSKLAPILPTLQIPPDVVAQVLSATYHINCTSAVQLSGSLNCNDAQVADSIRSSIESWVMEAARTSGTTEGVRSDTASVKVSCAGNEIRVKAVLTEEAIVALAPVAPTPIIAEPRMEAPNMDEPPIRTEPSEARSAVPAATTGSLSGNWRGSVGDVFRIEDDGTALMVELISNDTARTANGTITRRDDQPDVLIGSLILVWPVDAPNRHEVNVTGTIADQNTLRLRFTNWIQMEGNRIVGFDGAANDTWTRSGAAPAGMLPLSPDQE